MLTSQLSDGNHRQEMFKPETTGKNVILFFCAVPMATMELVAPLEVFFGSNLTLTCNATLPSSVDTEVTGAVTWVTPSGTINKLTERYTTFSNHIGSHTYQFILHIKNFIRCVFEESI